LLILFCTSLNSEYPDSDKKNHQLPPKIIQQHPVNPLIGENPDMACATLRYQTKILLEKQSPIYGRTDS
jgi:hypothetical protein